jgi:hypothetical protein
LLNFYERGNCENEDFKRLYGLKNINPFNPYNPV